MHASVISLLLTVTLAACGELKPAPPKACEKLHEQCTLPSGVLGVCNQVDCAAGQAEPCLVCRSQH
jgi:hypothetical protein